MKLMILAILALNMTACSYYPIRTEADVRKEHAEYLASRSPDEIKYDTAMAGCVGQANAYTSAQGQSAAYKICMTNQGY